MRLKLSLRIAATLLLALAAAALCVVWHAPLPWMIGPLLATALVSTLNAPTLSWNPLRNIGQWTIGAALGLYFTPSVATLVAGLWWALLLSIAWALLLGSLLGVWLQRRHAADMPGLSSAQIGATGYFAGAIGGASEMTLLAERWGARTDLVAASHSLRVLIVTLSVPFAMQFSGLHGLDHLPPAARLVQPGGLVQLALLTGLGALALGWLGRANPWFMGPLLVSMGLTLAGVNLSALPLWLSNAAQLFLAVSLGVRFSAAFLHAAPRWMLSVALGTLGMLVLCAGFAVLLAWATGLHPATLILATAPGGITEMAITAKVLQLGVPVVTAFQVCRVVAVLMLVGPLYPVVSGQRPPVSA